MQDDQKIDAALLAQLSAALDALPATFVVYGPDERLVVCNSAYRREYHPFEHEVVPGVSHTELQWLKVREGLDARAAGRADAFVADEQNRHRTGPELEEWQDDHGRHMRMSRTRLADGSVVGMRFDISDLREAQNNLRKQNDSLRQARSALSRQVDTDALTGLRNRRALRKQLIEMSRRRGRHGGQIALFFLDLDGFKQVNDIYGHEVGDLLLIEAGQRLQRSVPAGCTVARIGGDEFVVVYPGGNEMTHDWPEHCQGFGRKLVEILGKTYAPNDRRCQIACSIGVACAGGGPVNLRDLARFADFALQRAKRTGRSRCVLFDDTMRRTMLRHEEVAHELLCDTMQGQLGFHLQPVLSASSREVVGAEALIRWHHPDGRLRMPGEFLPVAEELRLISKFDQTTLENVLGWRAATGISDLPCISVNLSPQRLHDPDLLDDLRGTNVAPGAISFEILETVFSDRDDRQLQWNLDGLREMGFDLQIDDYGTAHSSISALLQIRPKRLKIDRQFAANLQTDEEAVSICRLTIALAHELGIEVTAEGVETEEQAERLSELGCDCLQGYLFSPPVAPQSFLDLFLGNAITSVAH